MGNLTIEYRRRIAKLLSGKAIVAKKGTNHIDDDWSENTIYKGEIAVNLDTGEIVSSDGETIIKANKGESVINGLQLYPVPGASNGANPLWINISSGNCTINGKTYWHKSVLESSKDKDNNGDFLFATNNGAKDAYWLVYARPSDDNDKALGEDIYDETLQQYKAKFFTFKVPSFNELFKDDLSLYNNTGYSLDDAVFLGAVFMPGGYGSDSFNELRPWSVSISNDYSDYSLNHSSNVDMQNITPGAFIDSIRKSLINYEPIMEEQRKCMVLIEGMTFKSGSNLYYVNKTHYCDDIDDSLQKGYITQLTGTGEGEMTTDNHSSLKNLSYDKSGHTGFQRQTSVSTSAPRIKAKNGDFWIQPSEDGKMLEAAYVYVEGAWQMFMSSTRDSLCHKNLNINTINEIAFNGKQKKTYVDVKVNGASQNVGIDCWFVDLETNKRTELEDLENWDSFNNTGKKYKLVFDEEKLGYTLTEEDVIGLYYMEATSLLRADDGLNIWAITNDEIDEDVDEFWKDGGLDPKLILVGEVETDEEIDEDVEEMWKDEYEENNSGD